MALIDYVKSNDTEQPSAARATAPILSHKPPPGCCGAGVGTVGLRPRFGYAVVGVMSPCLTSIISLLMQVLSPAYNVVVTSREEPRLSTVIFAGSRRIPDMLFQARGEKAA